MPTPLLRKDLNLKALELFQICVREGSLQAAANEAGLSISTVSHHLRNLEDHLGVALFDHGRKPLVVTPKGQIFLRNIDEALLLIRKAKAEASAGNYADASYLRLGSIEDFENDVTPELAVHLSRQMPNCRFLFHTDSSHQILAMLQNRELDLGITTRPTEKLNDVIDRPLLRDPFVLVLPATTEPDLSDILAGKSRLPFLQFSHDLIIAKQIEAQLRRLGVPLPDKFECASNQTLMAMVASGAGWTITTPLLFSRALRFQPRLRMQPFPSKKFARTLSLAATPDCSGAVVDLVEQKIRDTLGKQIIGPLHTSAPWLSGQFELIN